MSLVDLKSDLSKYRSEVSKEGKNTPDASSATSDKNFATQQPITDGLYKEVPKIKKPKVVSLQNQLGKTKLDEIKVPKPSDITKQLKSTELDNIKKPNPSKIENLLDSTKLDDIVIPSDKRIQLEDRLSSTKLDDIVQNQNENLLINSLSQFSPNVIESGTGLASGVGLEQIQSKFSAVNTTRFSSRLTESDVQINRTTPGVNNNKSDLEINIPSQTFERDGTSPDIVKNPNEAFDNITNPNLKINVPAQSINRDEQAVSINKDLLSPVGNITNPLITITSPPQFFDRTKNLVDIKKNVNDSLDNITIPDFDPIPKPLFYDRKDETPNIITDTIKEGLVVDPKVSVLRIDQNTIHVGDESQFNIDKNPIKFIGTSELEKLFDPDAKGAIKYSGQSALEGDISLYGLIGKTETTPGGRHEKPHESQLAITGIQEVNFFSNQFAIGFNQRQRVGDSKYIGFSQYSWIGAPKDVPATNFFIDKNGRGFQTLVDPSETLYQPNSSQYDFTKITGVNFFDGNNDNTLGGFTTFTPHQITEYKTESSFLGWQGNRIGAPATNFFDIGLLNTKSGFTKFAELGQSDYIPDSSYLDWDGNAQQSPSVNYFDLTGKSSNMGFHNFAAFQDSKYNQDVSDFVWKGNATQNAPAINYFDIQKQFTTSGFHVFHQLYDSKYIKQSSEFDWDGNRIDAPAVDYFDLTSEKTITGFNTFPQTYISQYVPESSRFTWVGNRAEAPNVNYLDISATNASSGFDTFTPSLESKYIKESSKQTWNVDKQDAPATNYLDILKQFTNKGFHNFHALFDSVYNKDSSQFDFNGTRQDAPDLNYFDLQKQFTTKGFHTFSVLRESKYIKDSSAFDWDGNRPDAPAINYFDLQKENTDIGFHTFHQLYDSKYIKESSRFDWDGGRKSAPAVNYFDLPDSFTKTGFHTFAQIRDSKYIPESSEFDWNGGRSKSPEVNFFDINKKVTNAGFHRLAEIYDSKYVEESSIFDWNGSRDESPQVNFFDLKGKFTTIGFHRLPELYDTKYTKDSSEFTFKGKFPAAGTDYFDKEKLNQTGFTLNIQPKGISKPPGTEYFHESSFYTFKGGRPGEPVESVINFFKDTNQTGFTMDIKRNEGLPPTEYATESSIFVFQGGRPKLQSFFPDDNQTGFTIDTMPKGGSRPGTEYETNSSEYGFKKFRRPPELNFFPDDNQTGFTLDIMPKGAGNPDTEYLTETSRFGFAGLRPKLQSFFPNDNQSGFTIDIMRKGSGRPQTEYSTESSAFDWNGTRTNAPSNNYFGLYRTPTGKQYIDVQQKNNTTQAGRGFQTFYTDKTVTNYAPGYSIHSTESGPNKLGVIGSSDKPVTNFFGFTPIKRNGFMPNMTQNDGTLYPIIAPELVYNLDKGNRLTVATNRASGGVSTQKGETFAPLSLGKRPWAQQGTLASLENQVPNIKTKAPAGAYNRKYERTLKDSTQNAGYLSSYGKDQGAIDALYTKFQLDPNAVQGKSSYNGAGKSVASLILRGIQRKGNVVNEAYGTINQGVNESFGGYSDSFTAVLEIDKQRIQNWLSKNSTSWNALQKSLYDNNPLVDSLTQINDTSGRSISMTRQYNSDSLIKTIENRKTRDTKKLVIRHGMPGSTDEDNYESVANFMNGISVEGTSSDPSQVTIFPRKSGETYYSSAIKSTTNSIYTHYKHNRLIALVAELLPSAYIPINEKLPADIKNLTTTTNRKISRLSGKGGPNSGTNPAGTTDINRASHPFLKIYDTSGVLVNNDPSYPSSAKRETWFGPKTRTEGTDEVDNTYGGLMKEQYGTDKVFDGLMTALSYLLNGPKLSGHETATYPSEGGAGGTGGTSIPKNSAYIQKGTYKLIEKRNPFDPNHLAFVDRTRANLINDDVTTTPITTAKIVNTPPSGEDATASPIKQYATVAYGKLKKIKKSEAPADRSADFNDFRHDIDDYATKTANFSTDPKIANYKDNNLETKFGFGNPGKVGVKRDKPYKTNIQYNGGKVTKKSGDQYEFRGDRINIIDYKKWDNTGQLLPKDFVYELGNFSNNDLAGKEDLIEFYFTSVNLKSTGAHPAEAIVFRAAFDTITDNHKPSWSNTTYMGRGDPIYTFGGYERDVSFGFTVHIGTRDEMKATWRKLNYLASWTAPDYRGSRMRAPLCRLNIGHLFRKTPGFINSLTYTFDNAGGTWETRQMPEDKDYNNEMSRPGVLQVPKTIQVAVGFTVIGNYRPERNSVFYSIFDDDGDGLLPSRSNDAKGVNYFKHDDDPATSDNFDEIPKPDDNTSDTDAPATVDTTYDTAQLEKLGIKTRIAKDKDGKEIKDADGNPRYEVDPDSKGFAKEDPGTNAGGDKVPAGDPNASASGTPASGTPGSGTPPTPHGGGP